MLVRDNIFSSIIYIQTNNLLNKTSHAEKAHPQFSKEFQLTTDSSNLALGVVLSHQNKQTVKMALLSKNTNAPLHRALRIGQEQD